MVGMCQLLKCLTSPLVVSTVESANNGTVYCTKKYKTVVHGRVVA